ncbi:MAG: arginyltransferase [Pseudomonadota bacterium]
MKHSLPLVPQFYVTSAQPCPYLEGRLERKLFTGLRDESGQILNDSLTKQGFRRSQNVLYRPACSGCSACISVRIRVADFKPSKSQRRVIKKNADLLRSSNAAWATDEQYDLFNTYLETRHADGGMADMDMFEFAAMIEETPIRTRVVEYHAEKEGRRRLQAACLTDILDDGLSMVYSFFDPDRVKNSTGRFMILDHINVVQEVGLDYLYLGYWVPGSPKMNYKAEFDAMEMFVDGVWQDMSDTTALPEQARQNAEETVMDQVARLRLPNLT